MTSPQTPSTFAKKVSHLTHLLTYSTRLAAASHRQADEAESSTGARAVFKRVLRMRPPQEEAGAAEREIQRYGRRLLELHAELPPLDQAQLEREVNAIATSVPSVNERAEADLGQAALRRRDHNARDAREVAAFVRTEVQRALGRITPPNAAPPARSASGTASPPPDSLLSPAASAFVQGDAARERIVDHIQSRTDEWWGRAVERHGLERMMPTLKQQAGDPLTAVRVASAVSGGVPLGTKLTPKTRKPRGQVVVDPTHTTLALGASGIGKTTGVVAPYAAIRAALGDNVVVVTPQSPTIELILPTAKALSGQERVPVVDFGGEIVGPDSPEFCTWDVTRNCLTAEGAMEFADAFAGPKLPARAQLSNPEYWGGIVWDMYGAAGHIAAGLRELRGLDPHGLNGMARVYDLMRTPRPGDLPDQLPAEVRAALAGSPAELRSQEALFRAARDYAKGFHPRLKRMAFNEHILRAAGIPLSDEIVGDKLVSLSEVLTHVGKSKQGDPMETLLTTFKRAVPPHEGLVMSPRPGNNEIDPRDLVKPGAGISFVAYAHTGSTGLAAGAFTSQVLDAAIRQNKDAGMLRSMGGAGGDARLSLVVDEGGAGRYIPRLPDVVTDTRQMGISALVSMTSEHHLRSVFGEEDAGKFLHAPCVIDMSPDAAKAAAIAPLFGQHVVERRSQSSGVGGGSVTRSEQKENILEAADVTRIPRGHAWVVYPSDPGGDRVKLVKLPQFEDPQTLVGAAVEYVRERPEEFEPVEDLLHRWRPDLSRQRSVQADPTAVLLEGSKQAVEDALADPAPEPAAAAKPEPVAEAEPARPVEPEPEPVARPAEPEPEPEPEPELEPEPEPKPEPEPEPKSEPPAQPAERAPEPEPEPDVTVRFAEPEPEPERPTEPTTPWSEPPARPVEVQPAPEPPTTPVEENPDRI